jgi:hypothetical protein
MDFLLKTFGSRKQTEEKKERDGKKLRVLFCFFQSFFRVFFVNTKITQKIKIAWGFQPFHFFFLFVHLLIWLNFSGDKLCEGLTIVF